MRVLTVLLDFSEKADQIAETASDLATLLNYELHFAHAIIAPEGWRLFSRSSKTKHPEVVNATNRAKEQMDRYLNKYRAKGLKARKQLFFMTTDCTDLPEDVSGIVMCSKPDSTIKNENRCFIKAYHTQNKGPVLLVRPDFKVETLNDVILFSEFSNLNPRTERVVLSWSEHLDFKLNLLFINTLDNFECSTLSIEKMKRSISKGGFKNTRMTVFNAETNLKGVKDYTDMQNCDLLIVENQESEMIDFIAELDTNLLFIV